MTERPTGSRYGVKLQTLIALITRPEGASRRELELALDWKSHTVRGCISAQLRQARGWAVVSTWEPGRGAVYRVPHIDLLGGAA